MSDARLADLRRRYAKEVVGLAGASHPPLAQALARVPRERFLGPGPWTIMTANAAMKTFVTPDDDPVHVYANVLVALDVAKTLNNGEPRFWAFLFDRLRPMPGERIVHVGAGTGYYTALLAEMAGPEGRVQGVEWEPDLAAKAEAALAPWPQARVQCGDGLALAQGPADVIVASCGLDAVPLGWVKLLADGGRLMFPLTTTMPNWPGGGWGITLMISRKGEAFAAEPVGGVGVYHAMSSRTETAEARLKAALGELRLGAREPRSLHLGSRPDDGCWLEGEGWWLSTEAA